MTPKQHEAVQAIKDGYRYILTGGAMSTAKTYGIAFIIISMAYQWPKTRYAVARLNLSTIKRTILQTFREVAEKMGVEYKENLADMMWLFDNGSQIWFVELDHTKDRDFNKLKGLELTAGAIDEANEVLESAFRVFSSRIGRNNHNKEPQFLLLSCNPSNTWVKSVFYDNYAKGELSKPYIFIPSLPKDNPFNNKEYLKALEEMPVSFKKRYVYGMWDYSDDDSSLFKYRYFDACITDKTDINEKRYIGYDVARSGSDRSVVSLWWGKTLVDIQIIKDKTESMTTDDQALELIKYMSNNAVIPQNIAVDAVGVGVGVVDHAKSKGIRFTEFTSGGKPTVDKYDNLRSQVIFEFAQGLEKGEIKIYEGCPLRNELISEAMLHTHKINDKKLAVEPKDKIKERTGGVSPDIMDAVVMGLYPQLNINPKQNISRIIY